MIRDTIGALPRAPSAGDRLHGYGRSEVAVDEQLLTAREVAAFIGVNEKRVYELGIPAIRISERSLRWRRTDVLQWIEERREAR
jgi:predicted DNA-binding transcriptional regulator AlpA